MINLRANVHWSHHDKPFLAVCAPWMKLLLALCNVLFLLAVFSNPHIWGLQLELQPEWTLEDQPYFQSVLCSHFSDGESLTGPETRAAVHEFSPFDGEVIDCSESATCVSQQPTSPRTNKLSSSPLLPHPPPILFLTHQPLKEATPSWHTELLCLFAY